MQKTEHFGNSQILPHVIFTPSQHGRQFGGWPLVVFLHGAGETGRDLRGVLVHGPPKLAEQGRRFPFVLLAPQTVRGWTSDGEKKALENTISQTVRNNSHIDPRRIVVTGISRGGCGTWVQGARNAQRISAIIPMCGWAEDVGTVRRILCHRQMPIWNFHGMKDENVSFSRSEEIISALQSEGLHPKFTVMPHAGHDCWTESYEPAEWFEWALSQPPSPEPWSKDAVPRWSKEAAEKNGRVLHHFYWPGQPETAGFVSVAGSFNDWAPWPMRLEHGKHVLDVLLDRGQQYQFKFVVDGEWRLTDAFPICKDPSGVYDNHCVDVA